MGRVLIVTGSNSGLGLGILERLIQPAHINEKKKNGRLDVLNGDGHHELDRIIMACRNVEKAESARELLYQKYPMERQYNRIEIVHVDLASPASVFKATALIKNKYHKVDVLFCNAGLCQVAGHNVMGAIWDVLTKGLSYFFVTGGCLIIQPKGVTTKEGYGYVFSANVFGHYLMIRDLESELQGGGRIIWSGSHSSFLSFFDINDFQHLNGDTPYQSSKFASDLLSLALNDRYNKNTHYIQEIRSDSNDEKNSTKKEIYSFIGTPGLVISSLSENILPAFVWIVVMPLFTFLRIFIPTLCMDVCNGAESMIHLANHPNPEKIDFTKRVDSLVGWKGTNFLTGTGGERYVEAFPLEEAKLDMSRQLLKKNGFFSFGCRKI